MYLSVNNMVKCSILHIVSALRIPKITIICFYDRNNISILYQILNKGKTNIP